MTQLLLQASQLLLKGQVEPAQAGEEKSIKEEVGVNGGESSLAIPWLKPKSKSACFGFYFSKFLSYHFDHQNLTSTSGDGQDKYYTHL